MRKIVVSALSAVLALALCGCAASEPATNEVTADESTQASEASEGGAKQVESSGPSERKPLEISESGYWVDSNGNQNYAVIIENPNTDWAVALPEVTIKGVDSSGNTVDTQTANAYLIFPEGKVAVCGTSCIEGATDIEFSVNAPDGNWTSDIQGMTQSDLNEVLYVESVNETVGERKNVVIAGDVVNKMDAELNNVSVNLVFRDESGAIVGGTQTYISTISPESEAPFSDDIRKPPSYATVEASADTLIS